MDEQAKVMRVRLERETRAFIHNDLGNAAHFLLTRIRDRIAADDRAGIFLDQMACVMMVAFSHEANVNFIGDRVFGDDWPEMKPSRTKLELLMEKTGLKLSWEERPLSSLPDLWKIRNSLAHGKPRVVTSSEEAEGTYDELYHLSRAEDRAEWEQLLTDDFLEQAYEDVDRLYNLLLEGAGIHLSETLSGGSSGMSYLGDVDLVAT